MCRAQLAHSECSTNSSYYCYFMIVNATWLLPLGSESYPKKPGLAHFTPWGGRLKTPGSRPCPAFFFFNRSLLEYNCFTILC